MYRSGGPTAWSSAQVSVVQSDGVQPYDLGANGPPNGRFKKQGKFTGQNRVILEDQPGLGVRSTMACIAVK